MKKYKRILTIDDDQEINKLLDSILSKEGYIVTTSTNFNDFFIKFKQLKPDMCLIDINLGEMNGSGFNILKTLRKNVTTDVKLIVVSRRTSEEDIQRAIELGADDFITKPIDNVTVAARVNSAFDDMFKDSTYLPYFAAPTLTRDAMVEIEMKMISLIEEGIKVFSSHFIAKGSPVNLTGQVMEKLSQDKVVRGFVKTIERSSEPQGYYMFISFNVEDEETLKNVRQMLVGL